MNKLNLKAINELHARSPKENGVKEDFYWAVHGNWPAIRAILEEHFAVAEARLPDDWQLQRYNALLDVLREFYRDMDGARDFKYSEAGLTIARKAAARIQEMFTPSPQREKP